MDNNQGNNGNNNRSPQNGSTIYSTDCVFSTNSHSVLYEIGFKFRNKSENFI